MRGLGRGQGRVTPVSGKGGWVAGAVVLTNSGANGGTIGVLSASTFTAIAGRRYMITISFGGTIQVGAGVSECQIRQNVTQLVTSQRNVAAGTVPGGSLSVVDIPGAGPVTYNFYTFTNATTVQLQSNYEIDVIDVGPA